MKIYIVKLLLAFLPVLFIADSPSWKVRSSAITFKIKNAGMTASGSFGNLAADIKFDQLKPEEGNIKASVDSKTLNTGNDMMKEHLSKPEYFDMDKFPKITLQSTKIVRTGPITYNGTFNLTMKGVTKEIIIPFTFMKLPEKTEIKGTFTVNRRDFGVGGNSMTLSDNAEVSIDIFLAE